MAKATTTMQSGVIKAMHMEKRFGFIQGEDGQEFFFHQSALTDGDFTQLVAGDRVRFDPGMGEKGPRANVVEVV